MLRQLQPMAGMSALVVWGLLTALLLPVAEGRAEPAAAAAANLRPETREVFRRYVDLTEARKAEELKAGPFLWIDGEKEEERRREYEALRRGEVLMKRIETRENGKKI